MVASDVYKIAKALSKEEYIKLHNMLRSDVIQSQNPPKKKNKVPDFNFYDALRFLLENHVKK